MTEEDVDVVMVELWAWGPKSCMPPALGREAGQALLWKTLQDTEVRGMPESALLH